MNKLAINLSAYLVENQYFKFLVVPQAIVAEIFRHRFAVRDCLGVGFKFDADAVSIRNAVFHIEKELLHSGFPTCDERRIQRGPDNSGDPIAFSSEVDTGSREENASK
jgi:hypothetical protein